MASFAPNASGFIKLDAQIKMQGKKTTKIRPVVIQLPSSLEAIRDEILNQHNTGTVPKGIKLSKYVLLSGTGAPLDDGFIPYLNSGERVILFEKKKEGTPSRDRSSSSYDGITGNQKKRSRALSLHLQTVHKLFQTKIITDDEKFLLKDMVISGDKDFEQLLELYEKGKTDELRLLLDSHMATKPRLRGNSVNYDNIVTREMSSISIDSNFSDGNFSFNEFPNLGFDSSLNRPHRSFSNSSWVGFNMDNVVSMNAGSGKHRGGKSERNNRTGTADLIGNADDSRTRTGTIDSIGSIVDINRSLSDDMFDNIVAKIADDGGFNYDEFSQGRPVVKLNTNKGILSQVQDDYYNATRFCSEDLTSTNRNSLKNTDATRNTRFCSNSGLGADLFNFDNDYMGNNVVDDDYSDTNINPIPICSKHANSDIERSQQKGLKSKKNISRQNGNVSKKNNLKYSTHRRRTRSSSEEQQYTRNKMGHMSGVGNISNKNKGVGGADRQMIGRLTKEERRKRIDRWLEKRKHRNWSRTKTHYKPRQDFANQRIRIKGRFVKIDKDKPLSPEIQAAIAKQKAKQEAYKKTREGKAEYAAWLEKETAKKKGAKNLMKEKKKGPILLLRSSPTKQTKVGK